MPQKLSSQFSMPVYKSITKIITIVLASFFLISCSTEEGNEQKSDNPVDKILGEKILEEEFRQDNFSDFLSLTRTNLDAESALYDITPLGTHHYVINQKKLYENARLFSAILRVDEQKVVDYRLFNDFRIRDQMEDSTGIYIILSNFGVPISHWKPSHEFEILSLDRELREKWVYNPVSPKFPIQGKCFIRHDKKLIASVNLVTSCHACYNTFELEFDRNGNCLSATEKERVLTNHNFDRTKLMNLLKTEKVTLL